MPPPPFEAHPSYGTGVIASFIHALRGLLHTVVYQRNMRVHAIAAVLVGLVGSGISLGLAEKVTLIFCVLMIFFAEILNSALEHLVDLAVQQFDEKARITKDAAAAGVLVLAFGTVVIFAAILVHNAATIAASVPQIQRQVIFGVPLTGCVGLLIHPRVRPLWIDALIFTAGAALLGACAMRTTSVVFTALTGSLLVLAGSAALARRRWAKKIPAGRS
jgi:diacylglycerol kinase (ATP)